VGGDVLRHRAARPGWRARRRPGHPAVRVRLMAWITSPGRRHAWSAGPPLPGGCVLSTSFITPRVTSEAVYGLLKCMSVRVHPAGAKLSCRCGGERV